MFFIFPLIPQHHMPRIEARHGRLVAYLECCLSFLRFSRVASRFMQLDVFAAAQADAAKLTSWAGRAVSKAINEYKREMGADLYGAQDSPPRKEVQQEEQQQKTSSEPPLLLSSHLKSEEEESDQLENPLPPSPQLPFKPTPPQ